MRGRQEREKKAKRKKEKGGGGGGGGGDGNGTPFVKKTAIPFDQCYHFNLSFSMHASLKEI